jgi:hypothetical protein
MHGAKSQHGNIFVPQEQKTLALKILFVAYFYFHHTYKEYIESIGFW